jgi:hypothetical protein
LNLELAICTRAEIGHQAIRANIREICRLIWEVR